MLTRGCVQVRRRMEPRQEAWHRDLQLGRRTQVMFAIFGGWGRGGKCSSLRLVCDRYIGEWSEGDMSGSCIFAYPDGTTFEGTIARNQPAEGVLKEPDGQKYR